MQLSYLTPSFISYRQTFIVRRENAFCKVHNFFGFVYHVSCLPWFETKNEMRCIDAPKCTFTHRNLPKSELFKMYMKSLDSFILASRDNWVSCNQTHFTETVEFLECSLASMCEIIDSLILSSLEPKAKSIFSDQIFPLSIIVVNFTFSSSSHETLEQFQPNWGQSILGWWGFKFVQVKGPAFFQKEIITK